MVVSWSAEREAIFYFRLDEFYKPHSIYSEWVFYFCKCFVIFNGEYINVAFTTDNFFTFDKNPKMPLPYCVYILFSHKDFFLYTGFTTNIEQRIKNHNSGGTKSTSYRGPLELIFCEFYLYKVDALKREGYFKTSMGKKALKLMLKTTLEKMNYKGSLLKLEIHSDSLLD